MKVTDWTKYPNFSKHEFDCRETGDNAMQEDFMDLLQDIRKVYGKPMIITSGYRHPRHSVEIIKSKPGEHTYGVAADISMHGDDVREFMVIASGFGVRRFGLKQKGPLASRFIHIGIGDRELGFPMGCWTY